MELKLHDNIQFIYELALAQLELEAFGVDFHVANGMRIFEAKKLPDSETLQRRLAYFQRLDGISTDYHFLQQYNQTRSVNQYLTHWIYPYKGKFHPQMIRALLNIMQVQKGETVLDPFIGSGTTAVEAQLLGINCLGMDVSPLCVLVSRVKCESHEIVKTLMKITDDAVPAESRDERVANFFKVAEMIAHSDVARRRKDFLPSFKANVQKMLASASDFSAAVDRFHIQPGRVQTRQGDARSLNLEDDSVEAIVTSPPYSIALDYVQNDAHALSALGYDTQRIKEDFIGVRGKAREKFELYNHDMIACYREMHRVLKPGRLCAVVIGNVTFQNEVVDTTGTAIGACRDAGFELVKQMDKIIFGLYNVMQREYILLFRKPAR